jgi:hypothetical protein
MHLKNLPVFGCRRSPVMPYGHRRSPIKGSGTRAAWLGASFLAQKVGAWRMPFLVTPTNLTMMADLL